jgi:predicted GNAT family N-acyltransferase
MHIVKGALKDAAEMALLKYDNLMHRLRADEVPGTHEAQVEQSTIGVAAVANLRATLANSSHADFYLIARSTDQMLGFCRLTQHTKEQTTQFRQFYVQPKLIGQKIGSRLMAEAKLRTIASKPPPKTLWLLTGGYNAKAQEMYLHWGFERRPEEEWIPALLPDGTPFKWVKMVLHL